MKERVDQRADERAEAAPQPGLDEVADEGGSEVCLLRRVCPACGHLHEGRLPDVCVRCGADLPE